MENAKRQTAHKFGIHWMPKIWLTFHLSTQAFHNVEHEMIILPTVPVCSIYIHAQSKNFLPTNAYIWQIISKAENLSTPKCMCV